MIESQLIKKYQESVELIHTHVDTIVKIGDRVQWTAGPYLGREAVVLEVVWAIQSSLKGDYVDVELIVKTERLDRVGFMTTKDNWHVFHKSFNSYFKRIE